MSSREPIASQSLSQTRVVVVKLFAVARDFAGSQTLELRLPAEATVGDVRQALVERLPAITALAPHLLFAVNAEYAGDATPIPAGAEVACIPPVSGG